MTEREIGTDLPAPRQRLSHIWPRAAHDHYVEPQWCSTRLFETESFGARGATVLDPCCGWGRILQAASAAGYRAIGADIIDLHRDLDPSTAFSVRDFLTSPPIRPRPWACVFNPPFDKVAEFCERAVGLATYKVAAIIPLRRLPAAHWLKHLPLETIYLLTPRPSMPPGPYLDAGGKAAGDQQEYCWLIFNKHDAVTAPRVCWLHRDGEIESE
jgi:hypothetical protein